MALDYKISGSGVKQIALCGTLLSNDGVDPLIGAIDEQIERNNNRFIIDLAELDYINSTGLNLLVNILTKARKSDGDVVIININEKIQQLLLITKLNTVFNVRENEQEALDFLK